ncbi:hypothetical protein U27_06136 [Candidatus Vecturithrix granuli]|uniref:Uncharacterized protein n=1 Tax=Vecturithrix granuli TaxID=1499967 RepID=A0A081C3K5_VECG1|nr:hypothetical protein U27_06136 [Candidatus Vecturithrix granuli]
MLQPPHEHNRQAIIWLEQFCRDLNEDSDMLETLPIEEVRAELQALGANVKGLHAKLARTLRSAKNYNV